MYVFCDLRSHTALHAGKMKLFAFKDDLFCGKSDGADCATDWIDHVFAIMICTFFLLFFILNLRENLCIRLLQAIRFQRDLRL